tara:strand:+ start:68338 stop:68829 length:492 start_codon:yes stop_codon:yes gene_type:complete
MISFKRRTAPHCFFLLLLTILTGCSDGDRATVYPTSGVVLYDGKPMLGGGAISFVPISTQKGKTAGGIIKEDGTFVMSTYGDGDGSIEGEFRVTIYQTTVQEPEMVPDNNEGAEPVKTAEPVQIVEKKDQIPRIYSDTVKSPLTVKIAPNGQNESLSIELKRL